jgi:glycosyltransferase involved in cell wall biosynthesis
MSPALVSVCIPAYNYGAFLRDAIGSACEQTYRNIEIIVADNCSTDGTPRIVHSLAEADARIRYHRNERNLGMQGNFNRCLELSRGEYVKFLCADDALLPRCVERMVDAAERHPDAALVGCGREIVDSRMRHKATWSYSNRLQKLEGPAVINRCFFRGNLIGEPTAVLFRKAAAGRGFSEAYRQVLDMEMWFHLLERGAFVFIPETLCRLRQHDERATFAHLDTGVIAADRMRLFREFAHRPYIRAAMGRKLLWDLRMAWLLGRERGSAGARTPGAREAVYFPALLEPLVSLARIAAALRLSPGSP